MALVTRIDWVPKERNQLHSETSCSACRYEAPSGKAVLQLDTHGSPTRKFPGKTSQSLQFDRDGAKELVAAIRRVFPDLF